MKLSEIITYLKHKLSEDERLNSVFVGDVYLTWNHKNSSNNFTSAVVDFASSNMNGDYVDYTFIVYVGSIINENQENIYRHISIADNIITQLLHKIDVEENDMVLVVPAMINPFNQSFEDVMAGCYCRFSVRVPIDIICA